MMLMRKSFTLAVALAAVLASSTTKAEQQQEIQEPELCRIDQERLEEQCTDICREDNQFGEKGVYREGSCVWETLAQCDDGQIQVDEVCVPEVELRCEEGQVLSNQGQQCTTVAELCGEGNSYYNFECYDPNAECPSGQIFSTIDNSCFNPCDDEEETFINGACYFEDEPAIQCNFDETIVAINDGNFECTRICTEGEWLIGDQCIAAAKPDDLCRPYEVYLRGICVQQSLPCSFKGEDFGGLEAFDRQCFSCPADRPIAVNGQCVEPLQNYCQADQEFSKKEFNCVFSNTGEACVTPDEEIGIYIGGECVVRFEGVCGEQASILYREKCYPQTEIDEICGTEDAIIIDGFNCANDLDRCTCGVFGGNCRRADFPTGQYVDCNPSQDTELIKEKICNAAEELAADANIDCGGTDPDPEPLPGFGALDERGTTYDQPAATTADGFELTLVRLTGTATDRRRLAAGSDSRGPVLLTHGVGADGSIWLNGPTDQPSLPEALFDAGYDVWIFNGRGTPASRFIQTVDPNADADAGQWNFGIDELAKEDIPAAINQILTTRQTENSDSCQKVKVVTEGSGGALISILMNDLPESSAAYIELAVNQGFCPVPGREFAVNPSPVEPDDSNQEQTDDAQKDEHWGYYNYYSGFDRDAYYAAFAEIRADLDYHTYQKFYYAYRRWESANYHDWWKNGKWQEGIDEALCEVQPSDMRCIPTDLTDFLDFSNAIDELGIVSLCGTEWTETDAAAVCQKTGEENYLCQELQAGCSTTEVSAETFKTLAQQAYLQQWARYNPDFSTNGWFAAAETYSTSAITVPVYNWFAQAEEFCPADLSRQIGDGIPTQSSRLTFTNGVNNAEMIAQMGASYNALLCNVLGSASIEIDGECAQLVFGEWN